MNRREFILNRLVKVGILLYPKCEVDKILDATASLSDGEFELYVKFIVDVYKDSI